MEHHKPFRGDRLCQALQKRTLYLHNFHCPHAIFDIVENHEFLVCQA
jgi:hypothetical protein